MPEKPPRGKGKLAEAVITQARRHNSPREFADLARDEVREGMLTEDELFAILDTFEAGRPLDSDQERWRMFYNLKRSDPNDWRGSDMTNRNLMGADLSKTDLSHILVEQDSVDLVSDAVTIPGSNPWVHMDTLTVGHCEECEILHEVILKKSPEPPADNSQRGLVFYWANRPIGYLKLMDYLGQPSFLALRTVYDE